MGHEAWGVGHGALAVGRGMASAKDCARNGVCKQTERQKQMTNVLLVILGS